MLIDGNSIKGKLQYDICIVGGGVAGIVLACELIESGKKVALVESGGENFNKLAQDLNIATKFPNHFPDPHYSRLRFLGGSSNHWENNTSPYSPIDFEVREGIAYSGWPISFDEVNQYYPKAGDYCGVGSDGYNLEYWSTKLGLKPVTAGESELESRIAKAALPPTRFFYKHGHKLVNSKNIDVITFATLTDITYSPVSKNIESAIFSNHNGKTFSVVADKFVMSLGGIENARMLLHFNNKFEQMLGNQYDQVGRYFMEHPTPRAAQLFVNEPSLYNLYSSNVVDNVGVVSFLSLSDKLVESENTINLRMPLIPQSNYTLSDGISSFHVLSNAMSDGDWPDFAGKHMLNIVSDWDMVIEAIARKQFDKKLFESASEIGGFQIPMMMEQTPNPDNRIRLSNDKDRYNIPKIAIDYRISDADKDRVWRSLGLVAKEVGMLGIGRLKTLQERSSRIWSDQLGYSNHHMGTTKMSKTPGHGVVDQNLKVFGTNNLFIGGSSTFPTGSHVPPTLTIAALSIRLAEHLS